MAKKRPAKAKAAAKAEAGADVVAVSPESENTGGLGGPSSLHAVGQRDTRLIERAVRQRWPVPEGCRQALIDRQIKIATNPKSGPREATIAFKAILAAEAQNQADELAAAKREQDDRHHVEGETVNFRAVDALGLSLDTRKAILDDLRRGADSPSHTGPAPAAIPSGNGKAKPGSNGHHGNGKH